MTTETDRIETAVTIKAPQSRVWRALANAEEFGKWFQVDLTGKEFVEGQSISATISSCGHGDLPWSVVVERIEPEQLFSFRWHPYSKESSIDYSAEERTLVEFVLKELSEGTLLTVIESGFDKVPPERRLEAFRMNTLGWAAKIEDIEKYASTT